MEATINSESRPETSDHAVADELLMQRAEKPINWRRVLIRPTAALGFSAAMASASFTGSETVFVLSVVQGVLWLVLFCTN